VAVALDRARTASRAARPTTWPVRRPR